MRESTAIFPEIADIETSSDDYATRFSGAVGEWFLRIQAEATLNMLAPYRGASVLDVGGGHGQLTEPLLKAGHPITVLGSAEVCRERIRHLVDGVHCSFDVGNILNLPYSDRSFDVVISYRLLPHVTRWQEFLGELARVAKQAIVLDYPEVRSINYATPFLFEFKKNMEGNTRTYTCFRENDLLSVVRSHGFERAGRYAEFFFPMVLHRKLNAPQVSTAIEGVSRTVGLTGWLGSPVILKLVRMGG